MESVLPAGNLSADELLFFNKKMDQFAVYKMLRDKLFHLHPDIAVKVSKTQVSFRNRYIFAVVSFKRMPRAPGEYLLVSFGLRYQKYSPRIAVATEATHNRWTHHVILRSVNEIDEELLDLIEEAYRFANSK